MPGVVCFPSNHSAFGSLGWPGMRTGALGAGALAAELEGSWAKALAAAILSAYTASNAALALFVSVRNWEFEVACAVSSGVWQAAASRFLSSHGELSGVVVPLTRGGRSGLNCPP